MKVFLSYALGSNDGALSARLRAVALAYNVDLLLPSVEKRNLLPPVNRQKIKDSIAVIILVSANTLNYRPAIDFFQPLTYEDELRAVNAELGEAIRIGRPVLALVENRNLITGLSDDQIFVFNRQNPGLHESQLFKALNNLKAKKDRDQVVAALGALGLVALGFFALGELTKDSDGK